MKVNKIEIRVLVALFVVVSILSCERTKVEPIKEECVQTYTYSKDIKPIIDASCAYVGCHINGTAPGNMDSYENLSSYLTGGQFENRVLKSKSMPPAYAPESRPKTLTDEELQKIQCWANEGYAK